MGEDATIIPAGVSMGIYFYPRGGSAQVVRYLSRALESEGVSVPLASGSLGGSGESTNAATFYGRKDVVTADFTEARDVFERGGDPMAESVATPMHTSFEDREGVPDRVLASLEPELGAHQVDTWTRLLQGAPWLESEVFHLHHITPLQDAVARLRPGTPVVTHVHGTGLKMLDRIRRLERIAARLGSRLDELAEAQATDHDLASKLDGAELETLRATRLAFWRYGEYWARHMREAARRTARFVTISPQDRDLTIELLDVPGDRIDSIPNGVDVDRFDDRDIGPEERMRLWRRWLVDDAAGWDESGVPGSIRYEPAALDAFFDRETGQPRPVLIFVGRFLGFKRVPLLIRAYARALPRLAEPAPLVIWGGSPGEWEGEHPASVARSEGVRDVFFVGWRGHDELPLGLACSSVLVAPSQNEPFGQVFLEAMACGLPVIGTRSGGPTSFVNTDSGRPNGWLVGVDDIDSLSAAIVEAVNDPDERLARGRRARAFVRSRYSWRAIAGAFLETYGRAREERRAVI